MPKREAFKDIDLNGRKWRIGRFDALTGSYIAYQLMSQMLPMGLDAQLGSLPKGREPMSKEAFIALQRDCLSVCSELKIVGAVEAPVSVMMPSGAWGVEGLEDDTLTVIMLTVHALLFNVSGFFDESLLSSVKESFKGVSLPFGASI